MDVDEGQDRELFAAYFQRSSAYYLEQLDRLRAKKRLSFNPYAFFCGIFWFLYRKLYIEFIIIAVLLVTEGQLEAYLYENTDLYEYATLISWSITILFCLSYGIFANILYLKRAEKHVSLAKSKFIGLEGRKIFLEKKGGTTFTAVTILLVLIVLFVILNGSVH